MAEHTLETFNEKVMAAKLTDITTQYHTFEDNQVLTAKQLNEFIDYFEDQDRLSRVFLSGVGIVCGFELKYDPAKPSITIGQGAGVTTDGDLVKLRQNSKLAGLKSIDLTAIEYTKYKVFDDSFGRYDFFKRLVMVDGKVSEVPIEMFEILPESAEDGVPLSLFSSFKNTSVSKIKNSSLFDIKDNSLFKLNDSSISALNNKVVLLYLEAYEKKADLCTSIDCDNQGVEQVARLRVLLVSKADAAFIAGKDQVYTKHNVTGSIFELPQVAVRRVVLNKLNSADYNELKRAYYLALTSDSLITNLSDGILKIATDFKSLLKLEITNETLQTTLTGLKNLVGKAAYNLPFNVQYRYDCIKDIVDTYNELKCNLTELSEECSPDIKSFPKHLMLGQLDEIASSEKHYRHGFYKSPILNCGMSKIQQCRSLVTRIFELINQFQTPVGDIKITPSNKLPELSLRSIPFYYNVQDEILASWNFPKTVKNKQNTNLSYHTTNLSKALHIQNPLDFNIDRFDFYRIEGHQGKVYQDVLAELDKLKTQYGLAFDVKALSVNINTENLKVDDYQCEFEDLNVLLRAWTAEQECVLAEISGFFSGFSTAVPGTNVKEPQLDIKKVAASEFLTNTAVITSDKSAIISRTAETNQAASRTIASKATTYTKSNVIPDNLTIKENALGNVMKVALEETLGGSVNDIIAKANYLVADKVNTDVWKNEPEIKAFVIDQSIELMAYTHVLSQRMPLTLVDITRDRITSYKLTMDDLCARVKKMKTSYQTTKLSAEMKAFMGILINQLANVCCSGKKLQILLEEVDKRKQDILVRLQLSVFVEKNPGLEHKAGVQPGGTFILVYLNKLPAIQTVATSKLLATSNLSSLITASSQLKASSDLNIANITKADTNLNFDKLSNLDISTVLSDRFSILDRLIRPVDLPDNTVVADFSLPYMCCSDCAPVNFIIQKPPVSLRLEKDEFCLGKDTTPLIFDVSPVDGVIKVEPPVEGVSVDGVKLFIDTETFSDDMLGKVIHFTVNDQITQATITVYRAIQFDFEVPKSPTSEPKITFIPSGDLNGATFAWDFGDGSSVSTERNPTHLYKLPVNKQNKVTVSLTVTAPNGVCHNTVTHDISFIIEETKINLDTLIFCSNNKNPFPFIITPTGADAKITGNGVTQDATGKFVFIPANAPVGETSFILNGNPSGLKVTVNEAPVAKFTPGQVGNQLILTNNSTGAISFAWLINGNKFESGDTKPFVIDLNANSPSDWTLILSAISETCGTNSTKEIRFTTKFEPPVNTCIDDVKGLMVRDAKILTKLEMPNSDLVQEIWVNTSALYGGTTQFNKGVLNDADNFLNGKNNESLVNLFIELMQATVNRIVEIDRIKRPEEFNALVQLFALQLQLFYNILGCQDAEIIKKFTEIILAVLNQIIELLQLLREVEVKLPDTLRTFIKAYSVRVSKIGLLAEHLAKINDENLI